jgi:hypothetical protein
LFVLFITYAGIGSPFPIDFQYDTFLVDKLFENLMILGIIFVSVSRVFPEFLNNLTLAIAIFGFQYVLKIWFPLAEGNSGLIIFGLVLGRFLGINHPPVNDNRPLNTGRIIVAVLSLLVFMLCFTPRPFG